MKPSPASRTVWPEHVARLAAGDGAPAWWRERRQAGLASFAAQGLPQRRQEAWRFTDAAPLLDSVFAPGPAAFAPERAQTVLAGLDFAGLDCHRLVFVDGLYRPELSAPGALPPGLSLGNLAAAAAGAGAALLREQLLRLPPPAGTPFAALNAALAADGLYLHAAPQCRPARPVHVVLLASGAAAVASHPRLFVRLEAGAELTLLQSHAALTDGPYFQNVAAEFSLAPGAGLDHYYFQDESEAAFHLAATSVRQEAGSRFRQHAAGFGARLARHDLSVVLAGEGCATELDALLWATGSRQLDSHSLIEHAQPHGSSRQLCKSILADRAQGVFDGRILVRPQAQQTDARQTSRALLLSREAAIHAKPQLEILADDVKCSHGATVGQLDADALFYLRARGLDPETARGLLLYAFAAEVLASDRLPQFAAHLEPRLLGQFVKKIGG